MDQNREFGNKSHIYIHLICNKITILWAKDGLFSK